MLLGNMVGSATDNTQHCTISSTVEAEYVPLGDGIPSAAAVRYARMCRCDEDEGVNVLAEKSLSSTRSRCIDVRCHFVRELVTLGDVNIHHVSSKEQHADAITRALGTAGLKRTARVFL